MDKFLEFMDREYALYEREVYALLEYCTPKQLVQFFKKKKISRVSELRYGGEDVLRKRIEKEKAIKSDFISDKMISIHCNELYNMEQAKRNYVRNKIFTKLKYEPYYNIEG